MLSTLRESKSTQCWRCLRVGCRPLPSLFWRLFTQPLVVHAPSLRPGPCSYDFPLSPSLQPLQCEAAQSHSIHNPALFVLNTTHCHPGYYPFTHLLLSDFLPSQEDEPLLQALLAYRYVSTPVLTHRTQHQHLLTGWGRTHCRQGSRVTLWYQCCKVGDAEPVTDARLEMSGPRGNRALTCAPLLALMSMQSVFNSSSQCQPHSGGLRLPHSSGEL